MIIWFYQNVWLLKACLPCSYNIATVTNYYYHISHMLCERGFKPHHLRDDEMVLANCCCTGHSYHSLSEILLPL